MRTVVIATCTLNAHCYDASQTEVRSLRTVAVAPCTIWAYCLASRAARSAARRASTAGLRVRGAGAGVCKPLDLHTWCIHGPPPQSVCFACTEWEDI